MDASYLVVVETELQPMKFYEFDNLVDATRAFEKLRRNGRFPRMYVQVPVIAIAATTT